MAPPDDADVQRVVVLVRGYIAGDPSVRNAFFALASLPLDVAQVLEAIVSGDHEPAIERQCDALSERLEAQRWRLRGERHAVQRHAEFNPRLVEWLERVWRSGTAALPHV